MANAMDAIKDKSIGDKIFGAEKKAPQTKRGLTGPEIKPEPIGGDDVNSMLEKIQNARTLEEAKALAAECLEKNRGDEGIPTETPDADAMGV